MALSGRVFQGLASDNVLHLSLNLVYVQTADKERASRLIGTSLLLYMLGISLSPFVVSLFDRFETSFAIALALFGLSLVYLLICVKPASGSRIVGSETGPLPLHDSRASTWKMKILSRLFASFFTPLSALQSSPLLFLVGFSLFTYSVVQSYIFAAILVHTAVVFHFSSRQNGILISLVHAMSAVYLLSILYLVPSLSRLFRILNRQNKAPQAMQYETPRARLNSKPPISHTNLAIRTSNSILGILSFATQFLALLLLTRITEPWQIYPIVSLLALGLATPSFVKSYVVAYLPEDVSMAHGVAALAICETLGSLLAPLILGGLQARWPGVEVFFVGAGIIGVAGGFFMAALGVGGGGAGQGREVEGWSRALFQLYLVLRTQK